MSTEAGRIAEVEMALSEAAAMLAATRGQRRVDARAGQLRAEAVRVAAAGAIDEIELLLNQYFPAAQEILEPSPQRSEVALRGLTTLANLTEQVRRALRHLPAGDPDVLAIAARLAAADDRIATAAAASGNPPAGGTRGASGRPRDTASTS
jgi:hypothetical protein